MDFEKQEELRSKYALIRRGLSALRNAIEGLTLMKLTGDPFFDDSEEARQKLIMIVEKAAHRATQSEIEALIERTWPVHQREAAKAMGRIAQLVEQLTLSVGPRFEPWCVHQIFKQYQVIITSPEIMLMLMFV